METSLSTKQQKPYKKSILLWVDRFVTTGVEPSKLMPFHVPLVKVGSQALKEYSKRWEIGLVCNIPCALLSGVLEIHLPLKLSSNGRNFL